jgi:hypothetical protein
MRFLLRGSVEVSTEVKAYTKRSPNTPWLYIQGIEQQRISVRMMTTSNSEPSKL